MLGGQAQAAVKQQHTARAKRVIFLFMNGGPSHIDTFDPKPALARHEGQQPSGKLYKAPKTSGFMSSPLKFHRRGRSGIEVSESLPRLGGIIDDCCVIRSMHTNVPNHEPALLMMNTRQHPAHPPPPSARGFFTAWAAKTKTCRDSSC